MREYIYGKQGDTTPVSFHIPRLEVNNDNEHKGERMSIVTVNTIGSSNYQSIKGSSQYHDSSSTSLVSTRTYLSRFWILFIFSLVCWFHGVQWNTWGPIAESMEAAFPGWGPSTVAMMANWGTIMFVVFVLPVCWAIQRCGLRAGVVSSAALIFLGTALRCITSTPPVFTVMCHICAILMGISSTLILAAPVLIASDWFPLQERTTAVAVMMGASQLGLLGSYLEPLLVRLPSPQVNIDDTRRDVTHLLYLGAGLAGLLLLAVLIYFPSKPPTPPSVVSSTDRLDFIPGLLSIIKNKQFIILLVAYGVSVGPPVAWMTVLDYSLLPLEFHQDQAMGIGISTVIVSSLSPVIAGRINDLIQGHLRTITFILMLSTSLFFYWFLLISYRVLTPSTWQVYFSVIGSVSCNFATIPLLFEVGLDLAYPVQEILVSGVIVLMDNITCVIFLLAFFIPNVGYLWMTYTLVLCTSLAMMPLIFVKFEYTRLNIDTSKN
nr:solute carrier family 49 member 4 homolog isoform X1 [Cherax quadricarinatus]